MSRTPDALDTLDILTLSEAAALCGRQPQAMQKAAYRGRLRARKVGSQWITTRSAVSAYIALVQETHRRRHLGVIRRKEPRRRVA